MNKKFWGLLVIARLVAYFFIPKMYATVTQKSVGNILFESAKTPGGIATILRPRRA